MKEKYKKNTIPLITFSPAKNGTRLFFVGDHTFFGDVVNIAETLQVICWYKVMDVSLYTSSLIMFPLKRQQQKWTIFCSTAITVSNKIMCLNFLFLSNELGSVGFLSARLG